MHEMSNENLIRLIKRHEVLDSALVVKEFLLKFNPKRSLLNLAEKSSNLMGFNLHLDTHPEAKGLSLKRLGFPDRHALVSKSTINGRLNIGLTQHDVMCLLEDDEKHRMKELRGIIKEVTETEPLCVPDWLLGWESGGRYRRPFWIKPIPLTREKVTDFRKWTHAEMEAFVRENVIPMVEKHFGRECEWKFQFSGSNEIYYDALACEAEASLNGNAFKITVSNQICFYKQVRIGFNVKNISIIAADDFKRHKKEVIHELDYWNYRIREMELSHSNPTSSIPCGSR